MDTPAFQDNYPEDLSHCYGCGRLNENGLHIKTHWEGDESVTVFEPKPYHCAVPGYAYGGIIASLFDCHGTGTASAAADKAENLDPATTTAPRYVTASLHVDYLRPTPLKTIEIRGKVKEMRKRKITIEATLSVEGAVCAKSKIVTVKMPENWNNAQ